MKLLSILNEYTSGVIISVMIRADRTLCVSTISLSPSSRLAAVACSGQWVAGSGLWAAGSGQRAHCIDEVYRQFIGNIQ